ncbi:zinc-binding dehydrogenase [Gemmatimonas groenlandica]|uniref:Alcohol dehydrogenase catalytic domain-containing protein n=1 Tax=Gemmatimonas groenlandica TaxID=2732249 RepID=A0A6M4IUH4_9BACT|nr:zinc-binding dehydrogenase [Gemmatimonas groenlandica]QJR37409.1 alcohol dehydrogenase catalytic domain-containing protein [Gemmatimonas groenlandica]
MRAVRLPAPGHLVEDAEVPMPHCGPGDVLVRVRAAGICHSDVHYRAGRSRVEPLPLTLGHEVAGEIAAVGQHVLNHNVGDAVCLHYLVTCGQCDDCLAGREQFCATVKMLGHFTDGGWAEYIAVPARNAVPLPHRVPFEQGAVMMCSSATSLHALRKGRLKVGESVLVVGAGGLGMSAVQLARALGASDVIAVDRDPLKLALAERFGARTIRGANLSPDEVVAQVRAMTNGRGVDVALELVGAPDTMRTALQSLAPLGRAVVVGLSDINLSVDTYRDLIGREAELIGSNDHLLSELYELVEMADKGILNLADVVTNTVPLQARDINAVLDALARHEAPVRTVVVP